MLVSLEWINQYLSKNLDLNQVVSAMERAGIEIEKVEKPIEYDKKIITVEVIKVQKHPNADRLKLAIVNTGKTKIRVVCGAPNLAEDQKVVLATVGAKLPGGTSIKASEIRGELSHGMLCSEQELGMSENHEGILVLADNAVIGKPIATIFNTHSSAIDVKTAANRPDLQSYIGIAREVAVHTNTKLKLPNAKFPYKNSKISLASVDSKDLVPRYSLARFSIKNEIGESPHWLKQRLISSGIRPINTVVDVTNYVMSEVGQPLHAFDAAKPKGALKVRLAKPAEKLVTLDGKERQLGKQDLVIADSRVTIGLAGVMGGQDSEISSNTKEILLESAIFDGTYVRKTAQSQHLRSEASARFERGLPMELVELGMVRALGLLNELVGIKDLAISDVGSRVTKSKAIDVDLEKFARLSSLGRPPKSVIDKLDQLGFAVNNKNKNISVVPPYWRPDLKIAEDIFEEIIKLMGLEAVPATLPNLRFDFSSTQYDSLWPKLWQLRASLAGTGLQEVSTYPFTSQKALETLGLDTLKHLKVKNPRSPEQAYLRSNLIPGLLEAICDNVRRRSELGMFEIANIYLPDRGYLPQEQLKIGVITCGKVQTFEDIKVAKAAIAEAAHVSFELEPTKNFNFLHPLRQMLLRTNKQTIGFLGELHPRLLAAHKLVSASYLEVDINSLIAAWKMPKAITPSHLPEVKRDITVIIDRHVSWQSIVMVLDKHNFGIEYMGDYYDKKMGKHKKALTIRVTFSPKEKTLIESEISNLLEQVEKLLKQHFGAVVN